MFYCYLGLAVKINFNISLCLQIRNKLKDISISLMVVAFFLFAQVLKANEVKHRNKRKSHNGNMSYARMRLWTGAIPSECPIALYWYIATLWFASIYLEFECTNRWRVDMSGNKWFTKFAKKLDYSSTTHFSEVNTTIKIIIIKKRAKFYAKWITDCERFQIVLHFLNCKQFINALEFAGLITLSAIISMIHFNSHIKKLTEFMPFISW